MQYLVIQTAFLGDVVLTTPLIKTLQEREPGAQVHVVTTPAGARVLEGLPGVIAHALDKTGQGLWQGLQAVNVKLAPFEFEAVYCVHRSPRSLWIGRRVKARRRFTFASTLASLLGYETRSYPDYNENVHYVDKVMALLGDKGPPSQRPQPVLAATGADQAGLASKISTIAGVPYAVLSPFSAWGTKMWPVERFAEVARWLTTQGGKAVVVIGGEDSPLGKSEFEAGQRICAAALPHRAINLVGQTSVGELKALIKGADLLVSNDSAPVHIAAAFQCPTAAVFGPTVGKWGFFPLSAKSTMVERSELECRPCSLHGPHRCPLTHFECMNKIESAQVIKAIQNL